MGTAELAYCKGQTVSTSDKNQQFYIDMVHENMLTTSWFTKLFADRLDTGGWYLYDTPAHKDLHFRIAGPPIDKGTRDDLSGVSVEHDGCEPDDTTDNATLQPETMAGSLVHAADQRKLCAKHE